MSELIIRLLVGTEVHVLLGVCLVVVRSVEPAELAFEFLIWHWNKHLQIFCSKAVNSLKLVLIRPEYLFFRR